ncbi:monoheme cytochrome C [Aquimarina celericrescens]|uniref:Monoheme cytochrome C n=1 Tax=Aquimarina celericrescens TaxID=1964542 RepID=A0ABW5AU63_9FLAO|nr:monoheme cytochrome C [Aquimarina celericrescens]
MDTQEQFRQHVKTIFRLLMVVFTMVLIITIAGIYLITDPTLSAFKKTEPDLGYVVVPEEDEDRIENGVHVRTGLVEAEGLMEVVNNCTNCHSSKLVTQNRMTAERWIATIRWMQETQNLWDLGGNEEIIVNYLVANYPPTKKGRREILRNIEWYDLQD